MSDTLPVDENNPPPSITVKNEMPKQDIWDAPEEPPGGYGVGVLPCNIVLWV